MMGPYRVRLVSQTNIAVLIALLIFLSLILIATVNLKPFVIPFFIIYFGLAVFLWRKFVTGITVWTLTESGISIIWEKRFFKSATPDYFFKWSEIEKIWKGMDPNYYNLKFRFHSGNTITFFHNGANDDFAELLQSLYSRWEIKKMKP